MPLNYNIEKLQQKDGQAARTFCLETIKESFGYDYHAFWHIDLDHLDKPSNDYTEDNRGAFYIARLEDKIIGAAGLRTLTKKPNMVAQFKERYPDPEQIGSFWRFYINPEYRRQGIGSALVETIEKDAQRFAYTTIYLHTSHRQPNAIKFWQKQGFIIFLEEEEGDDVIVHMDKPL